MIVEVVKDLKVRGTLEEAGKIYPKFRDYEYYISLFPFDKSIEKYVEINGSISGHKGKHYCKYILIDIDSDNLEEARQSTIQLIQRLNLEHHIDPNELYIWFSGNKGFHIALVNKIYGKLDPCEHIAEKVKNAIAELSEGIDNIDLKIYENHRLIRVENSLNIKSGLYKIQISYDELLKDIESIKELAKQPREFKREILLTNIRFYKSIANLIKLKTEEKNYIENGFFLPSEKGNRNDKLFKQACMLFNKSELHDKSILEIIKSFNMASPEPLPEHEIITIVRSAKRLKNENKDDIIISTFADLIPLWLDSIEEESNKISLVFPSLNYEFQGKLRGKVGVVIGYGGSKKSIYGANVCFNNIYNNQRCIYSNMEMGEAELMSRFINIAISDTQGLPTQDLEKHQRNNANNFLNTKVANIFKDKLLICQNSNMNCEKYDMMLSQAETNYGKTDILIIDGFSMMGGKGTETEVYTQNSKELKELAKKWNIFILSIVHASKGEDYDTRDLTRKARSSEKIMDNCDWAMTLSQVKGQLDYERDKGAYHLWNKRGSGFRIEKGFKFQENSLRVEEFDLKDLEYEL